MKLVYVLLVGALLPVGLVLYIGSYFIERLLNDIAEDDAVSYAEAVSCELNAELVDRTVIWQLYGNTPFVQSELRKSKQQSSPATFPPGPAEDQAIDAVVAAEFSQELSAQTRVTNRLYEHLIFGEVLITDQRGALAAANNHTTDFWQNDELWWQKAVEQGVYLGDKQYDESAAMESVAVCVRIDDRQGNLAGVVKAVLDIQDIDSIIHDLPTARVTHGDRRTWLVTADGSVLGAANAGSPPYEKPCESLQTVLEAEQHGFHAILRSEVEEGPARLISFARPAKFGKVSNPNWIVLVESSPEATSATFPQFHYALKFIGLLGVISGGVATYYVSRRFQAE